MEHNDKTFDDDWFVPSFTFTRFTPGKLDSFLFEEVARLRHDVYCEECGFLSGEDYDDGMEVDGFEGRSIHVAAQTNDERVVGTVRLVLADKDGKFPFESHCEVFPHVMLPPPGESGEVSRLIVAKDFRRRAGDSLQGVTPADVEGTSRRAKERGGPRINRRSSSPQIMLGMCRELYRHASAAGVNYWYAAMERKLAVLLGRMGFNFTAIGPEMDYYGPVTIYMADLRELEKKIRAENPFLAAWFKNEPLTLGKLTRTFLNHKRGKGGKF